VKKYLSSEQWEFQQIARECADFADPVTELLERLEYLGWNVETPRMVRERAESELLTMSVTRPQPVGELFNDLGKPVGAE